jgi:hypothetical protein
VSSQPPTPSDPQGRLIRSTSRPGLTAAGVALISVAVGLVASIVAELVTGGLGWVFGIPFILVSVYCAAEVSSNQLRTAVVTPPLVALLVAVINPIWAAGDVAGLRGWTVKTLTTLTTMAPTLLIATGLAALIVGVRHWRARSA